MVVWFQQTIAKLIQNIKTDTDASYACVCRLFFQSHSHFRASSVYSLRIQINDFSRLKYLRASVSCSTYKQLSCLGLSLYLSEVSKKIEIPCWS